MKKELALATILGLSSVALAACDSQVNSPTTEAVPPVVSPESLAKDLKSQICGNNPHTILVEGLAKMSQDNNLPAAGPISFLAKRLGSAPVTEQTFTMADSMANLSNPDSVLTFTQQRDRNQTLDPQSNDLRSVLKAQPVAFVSLTGEVRRVDGSCSFVSNPSVERALDPKHPDPKQWHFMGYKCDSNNPGNRGKDFVFFDTLGKPRMEAMTDDEIDQINCPMPKTS